MRISAEARRADRVQRHVPAIQMSSYGISASRATRGHGAENTRSCYRTLAFTSDDDETSRRKASRRMQVHQICGKIRAPGPPHRSPHRPPDATHSTTSASTSLGEQRVPAAVANIGIFRYSRGFLWMSQASKRAEPVTEASTMAHATRAPVTLQ